MRENHEKFSRLSSASSIIRFNGTNMKLKCLKKDTIYSYSHHAFHISSDGLFNDERVTDCEDEIIQDSNGVDET